MNPESAELLQQAQYAAVMLEEVPTAPAQSPVALSPIVQLALKEVAVLNSEQLVRKYGTAAYAAIELAKSQPLTAQQARVKYERAKRLAAQEYRKDLGAAGVKPMQHSVKDYVHVICTQLELQLNGENPSANEVLNLAFPDDPKKATRIGESTRMQRVQEAFDSPEVMNHTVEKAMLEHHGQRRMNLRTQTPQFSHSLAAGVVLFEGYTQGAEIDQLKARVKLLEQKVECTNNREALADAGCTTSEEKVLSLYAQGKKQKEISELLNMKLDAVKYHLKKLPKQA